MEADQRDIMDQICWEDLDLITRLYFADLELLGDEFAIQKSKEYEAVLSNDVAQNLRRPTPIAT